MSGIAKGVGRVLGWAHFLLIVLFLAATLQAADWPMRRGNKQRTGSYEGANVKPPFVLKWQCYRGWTTYWVFHSPIVVGDVIYLDRDIDGPLLMIDASRGALIAELDDIPPRRSEVIYEDGFLHYGTKIFDGSYKAIARREEAASCKGCLVETGQSSIEIQPIARSQRA